MGYKIIIYADEALCEEVHSEEFNRPEDIEHLLEEYEGYYCEVYYIEGDMPFPFLTGAFDDSFLDKYYYL